MTNKEASEEISKLLVSENLSRNKLSTILGLKDQTLRNKIHSNSFTSKNLEKLNDYLNEDKKVFDCPFVVITL